MCRVNSSIHPSIFNIHFVLHLGCLVQNKFPTFVSFFFGLFFKEKETPHEGLIQSKHLHQHLMDHDPPAEKR